MKKKFVFTGKVLTTGLLSLLLVFGSCQKEEVESVEDQNDNKNHTETLANIKQITYDFIREQQLAAESNDRALPGWLTDLAGHVMDDLRGAATGAKVGALFGPEGALIGAGIGAAAGTLEGMGNDESISEDDGAAVNPANAYDNAGTIHNGVLYHGYMENYETIITDGSINSPAYIDYTNLWLVDNGFLSPGETSGFTPAQLDSDLAYIQAFDGTGMQEFVDVYYADGLMGTEEFDVLSLYYEAMESASTLEDFLDYSVSVEEAVSVGGYSVEVESYILSCMSVTRQDLHYWDANIE